MSSRHRKYQGGRDSPDDPARSRKEEKKERRTGLETYWINGEGIVRDVLQRQICRMLGNDARSQPGEYKGVPGYRIQAVRPFTQEQIDDLIEISSEYLREKEDYARDLERHKQPKKPLPYEGSATSRRYDDKRYDDNPRYPDERYPQTYPQPNPLDTYGPSQTQYPHSSNSAYQPRGGDYSPGPQVTSASGYPAAYASSRAPPDQIMDYGRAPGSRASEAYQPSNLFGAPAPSAYGQDPSMPRWINPMEPAGPIHRTQQPYTQTHIGSPDVVMQDQYSSYMDMEPSRTAQRIPAYQAQPPPNPRDYYDDRPQPPGSQYQASIPREEKRPRHEYDRRR